MQIFVCLGQVVTRPFEVRPISENFVRSLMARIIHNPYSSPKKIIVMIDLAQCPKPQDYDHTKFLRGEYTAWVMGGSHKTQAVKMLRDMPDYKGMVAHLAKLPAITYAGLSREQFHLVIFIYMTIFLHANLSG